MAHGRRSAWWQFPLTLLAVVALVFIAVSIVKPFAIPSGSMEPTLQVGDRVLVNRLVYRLRPIERGDVVVFDGRDSFTADNRGAVGPVTRVRDWIGDTVGFGLSTSNDFVKRVIGVGGDRVSCCDADGRVTVNGRAIDESSVLMAGDAPSEVSFDVHIPEGMLWLMGDHRSASADSRAHLGDPGGGMVSENAVVGRVMSVVWPLDHLMTVPIPDVYASTMGRADG